MEKILKLAKKLIQIESTSKNPEKIREAISLCKDSLSKDLTIEEFEKNGSPSLLVHNQKAGHKNFKLILNGHIDVVDAPKELFNPKIKKNKLYGRGSNDMKSTVAIFIILFNEIASSLDYPIALQIVADEEIGGFNGTKHQVDKGITANFAIAGESTNFDIKTEAKGVKFVKITFQGKSAHGAYPWNGENALICAVNFINKIQETYPIIKSEDWKTTINYSNLKIENESINKVPDNAELILDIRYIPEDESSLEQNIKDTLPPNAIFEYILDSNCHFVDKSNTELNKITSIIKEYKNINFIKSNGASDARHFTAKGVPAIEFGPSGKDIHGNNEHTDIKSLNEYYKIMKAICLGLGA